MTEDRIMGQRAGIRWAIATLHKYAGTMNDPKAKAVLNAAAHELAIDAKALRTEDAEDIAAGLEALNTPIVATWPEVRDRLGLERLGAEFEKVWDDNANKLYED